MKKAIVPTNKLLSTFDIRRNPNPISLILNKNTTPVAFVQNCAKNRSSFW